MTSLVIYVDEQVVHGVYVVVMGHAHLLFCCAVSTHNVSSTFKKGATTPRGPGSVQADTSALKQYRKSLASLSIPELQKVKMSRGMGFPTMWFVRPAKPQISLRICAV